MGFQCPTCVAEGSKAVRAPRTIAGGAIPASDGLVSMVLIGLNVAVFALTLATGGRASWLYEHGAMLAATVRTDAFALELLTGVSGGAWWRLGTSGFLHYAVLPYGLLHLGFNMYALYLFGPFVERMLGHARFVVAYLTMVIGASVFVYWLSATNAATVGASGAVFGLFGMTLVLLIKSGQDVRGLIAILAINAFISLQISSISWQGHLGGFVTGCVLGAAVAYAPRDRRNLVQAVTLAAVWIAIVVAVVVRTSALT